MDVANTGRSFVLECNILELTKTTGRWIEETARLQITLRPSDSPDPILFKDVPVGLGTQNDNEFAKEVAEAVRNEVRVPLVGGPKLNYVGPK